jgi:hypothetical protein
MDKITIHTHSRYCSQEKSKPRGRGFDDPLQRKCRKEEEENMKMGFKELGCELDPSDCGYGPAAGFV